MGRGINKVILVGNLGADPETRYTASGKAVTTVSIATTDVRKDKESGENKEHTEWHRVKFWDRLAEIANEYLHKGSQIYIEGRLQTNKWQDKEGKDNYTTEIIAYEMQMLGGRSNAGGGDFNKPSSSRPNQQESSADNGYKQNAPVEFNDDDDIPF